MGEFAGPLGGAAAGAVAGGFVGMPQLGAAVGWLVGSWLFGKKTQEQNQIIDPGAEEMPRFNQALRGVTIPVLFGTNKVSSQIVWQNNFQTLRQETSSQPAGAAKGGGSGMGAKGGAGSGSTTVAYTYKWDLIYHFGMVPEAYTLYGGWVGTQRLSSDTILKLTGSIIGESFGLVPPSGNAEKASLHFTEGVFFGGSSNVDEFWTHLTSVVGFNVGWPHTAWIGFKELELGSHPNVPQLFVEIGPGGAEITPISDFLWAIDELDPLTEWQHAGFTKYQMTLGWVNSGTLSTVVVRIIDFQGVQRQAYTVQQIIDIVNPNISSIIDTGSVNLSIGAWSVLMGGKYSVCKIHSVIGISEVLHICVFQNESDGGLTYIGHGYYERGSTFVPYLTDGFITHGGAMDEDAPLYLFGGNGIGGVARAFACLPSITNLISGSFNHLGSSGTFGAREFPHVLYAPSSKLDYLGSHSSNGNYSFIRNTRIGFVLPTYTISLTLVARDYYYVYVSKPTRDQHSASGALKVPFIVDNYAAYPNGFIFRLPVGPADGQGYTSIEHTISGVNKFISISISDSDIVVVNDKFNDRTGNADEIPFDDEGEDVQGNVNAALGYFEYFAAVEALPQGGFLIFFNKYDFNLGGASEPNYFTIRAFVWNPVTEQSREYAQGSGSVFLPSDFGDSSSTSDYDMMSMVLRSGEYVYIGGWTGIGLSAESKGSPWLSQFGTFNLSGGVDIPPPAIIREILAHPVFGIGFAYADIDETSYQFAFQFCEANNYLVSTQYRREQGSLDTIELLLAVYGGFLAITTEGTVKFGVQQYQSTPVRTIDNNHLLIDKVGEPPVSISKGAPQDTFNKVLVNFIDRNLDYQQNQVEDADEVDQDVTGIRKKEFPPQFVMAENTARTIALRALINNLYARDIYSFMLGPKDQDLEPGDLITLVDSYSTLNTQCRITRWEEKRKQRFEVKAVQELAYVSSLQVSSGFDSTSQSTISQLTGNARIPLMQTMYELPPEFQQSGSAKLYVGYLPDGFVAGATLYVSPDGTTYAPVLDTQPYPIAGVLQSDLPNNGETAVNVQVALFPASHDPASLAFSFDATLDEVTPAARAIGLGLMWAGSEMLAYESVTLLSQNTYRLGKVYRGWGGTYFHAHNSGDYWHKHGGGIFAQAFNEDQIGRTIYYKVVPYNLLGYHADISSIDAGTYVVQGIVYKPRPPSTPFWVWSGYEYRGTRVAQVNSEIDIEVKWHDVAGKTGFGFGGYGGTQHYGNFAADPASKEWHINVVGSGGNTVRSMHIGSPYFTYSNSMNIADNGAWRGILGFTIAGHNAFGHTPVTEVLSLELFQ